MNNRNHKDLTGRANLRVAKFTKAKLVTSTVFTVFAVMALAVNSLAGELPEAPSSSFRTAAPMTPATVRSSTASSRQPKIAEARILDEKFVSLALISTGATFADSYTTLFARQNWLAHKQGVCNMEVQSAYLYGTHPTVGRAYAVASVKSAGSMVAAYYLRKHHSRLWSVPLLANSIVSLEGVTQNMIECN